MVSLRDITERKKAEKLLEYVASHDYLTDLPNRVYFEKQVDTAIFHANEHHQKMALLYLDLDNFKVINDTLGHGMGDQVLQKVSVILKQSIRHGDTVARLGGDEFALILNALEKSDYAATVARHLLDNLRNAFYLDGKEVYVNASIGIAVYPSGEHRQII